MIQPKFEKGMAVQVLMLRDNKPKWVGGFVFVRAVDEMHVRVQQIGERHVMNWTHDRVRPDVTPIRFG